MTLGVNPRNKSPGEQKTIVHEQSPAMAMYESLHLCDGELPNCQRSRTGSHSLGREKRIWAILPKRVMHAQDANTVDCSTVNAQTRSVLRGTQVKKMQKTRNKKGFSEKFCATRKNWLRKKQKNNCGKNSCVSISF